MLGELIKVGSDLFKSYFPPDLSQEQKAKLEQGIKEYELQVQAFALEQEKNFNVRIMQLEGTANDLRALPLIGRTLLFLRGAQRPLWGYATMYADFMIFADKWSLTQNEEHMMLAINILVLGFLFGERAVKNILPLLQNSVFAKGKEK